MLMQAQALARHRQLNLRHHALPTALGMLRYHENRLDEAEEYFMEARTLCKCAGDRVNEFQANEYLVMIDFERGRLDSACARCAALVEIGDRLREGSEAPFAQALQALCRYAQGDDPGPMEEALEALRLADAKYRLAYILTRTALLDIDRGRPREALARASEALECASVLDRATEMLLAHLALARAHRTLGETAEYRRHAAAIADLADAPVAVWARQRAQTLATAAAG
jgi:tetratricopeptide (TPR) repeat protein